MANTFLRVAQNDNNAVEKINIYIINKGSPAGDPLFVEICRFSGLKQSVGTQDDEYTITEEQAYDTNDETNLDHILLLDEASSVCQSIGRSTDGEYHTY